VVASSDLLAQPLGQLARGRAAVGGHRHARPAPIGRIGFGRHEPAARSRLWYSGTVVPTKRVQTGVRVEARLLKVLKALAEYLDLSLGDLLEGIVLHAFERRHPFDEATIAVIGDLKRIYGLDLRADDSHQLIEDGEARA
jgi:hypothetical protein